MAAKPASAAIGFAAATAVVLIWSGWLVTTRAGAQSALTIYDMTALRFGVSALLVSPIVAYYRPWRGMTFRKTAGLAITAGVPYALFSYLGFVLAPAAHGGVFMNGMLPALTLGIGFLWLKDRPYRTQMAGAGLIIVGACMVAADSGSLGAAGAWQGDLLFLGSALSFAAYMVLYRRWPVTVPQLLMCVPLINGLIYVPIWAAFLPSRMAEASHGQLLLQGFYQGVVPNLIGLMLVAIAIRNVGPPATAAFMSAVPGLGAILGWVILSEPLGLFGWLGIAVLTPGVLLTALWRRRS
ncbi:MAG: DMT family transporter [Alphaproteobacteria bacterium]